MYAKLLRFRKGISTKIDFKESEIPNGRKKIQMLIRVNQVSSNQKTTQKSDTDK